MLRVVVDPGVLVSAALSPRAAPADLLRAWREGAFELVVSPWLLQSWTTPCGARSSGATSARRTPARTSASLHRNAVTRSDPDVPTGATPDPGDDYLVGLAGMSPSHTCSVRDRRRAGGPRPAPAYVGLERILDLWSPAGLPARLERRHGIVCRECCGLRFRPDPTVGLEQLESSAYLLKWHGQADRDPARAGT